MRPLPLVAIFAFTPLLGGCDLALSGLLMPPVLPGIGFPLTGVVKDSLTQLPVGGATVQSGFGSTVTDGTGRYALYGGLGSTEVSVCRAGYTGYTEGDVDPNASGDLDLEIDPLFPDSGSLVTRFIDLSGTVSGLGVGGPAEVFFGDQTVPVNATGTYALEFKAGVPGQIFSSMLAWGAVTSTYNPNATTPVPFNYTEFHYQAENFPMGDTVPQSKIALDLKTGSIGQVALMKNTTVSYKNLGALTSVQTLILLDFGLLGSVPVAVATGSNQTIPVPSVGNLKYDVIGSASDSTGNTVSSVNLTTNDPSKATFQLLDAPQILSPTNNAAGAGQRPTFSWTTSDTDSVTYEVTLYEQDQTAAKWVGHTSSNQIQYPAFSQGDINGGALRSDKKYTWTLKVLDALGATQVPSDANFQPYRVRQREVDVSGLGFSL